MLLLAALTFQKDNSKDFASGESISNGSINLPKKVKMMIPSAWTHEVNKSVSVLSGGEKVRVMLLSSCFLNLTSFQSLGFGIQSQV